ncbi:DNA/RNA non-specific endonuclease [Bacillus atrophaeus]|uniref:DNA/RNA non-specific endonuclease n=1 Tax=Bacillus atrophaeus TaxID=1452 RepID=UPI003EBC7EB1
MSIGEGFDPTFLGPDYPIPFPTLREDTENVALEGGKIFNFTHFSIVMNRERKFPIYGANNTDLGNKEKCNSDLRFRPDSEIGEEYQVGNCLYSNDKGVWDQGHLVKRDDVCWGELNEAVQANKDSFVYANRVPQHHLFHSSMWGRIENLITERTKPKNEKLSIFTGPIFTKKDKEYCNEKIPKCCAKIPVGFWKVVFYISEEGNLEYAAFILLQDCFWRKFIVEEAFHTAKYSLLEKMDVLLTYQVSLKAITEATGIIFDEYLYEIDCFMNNCNSNTEGSNVDILEAHLIKDKEDLILG